MYVALFNLSLFRSGLLQFDISTVHAEKLYEYLQDTDMIHLQENVDFKGCMLIFVSCIFVILG